MSLPETKLRVIQSMSQLYDKHGHKMSIHFRMDKANNEFQVIVNRSCPTCKEFGKLSDGTEICNKCHYLKNWLELGKI